MYLCIEKIFNLFSLRLRCYPAVYKISTFFACARNIFRKFVSKSLVIPDFMLTCFTCKSLCLLKWAQNLLHLKRIMRQNFNSEVVILHTVMHYALISSLTPTRNSFSSLWIMSKMLWSEYNVLPTLTYFWSFLAFLSNLFWLLINRSIINRNLFTKSIFSEISTDTYKTLFSNFFR